MAGPTKLSKNGKIIEYWPPLPKQWADLYTTWNLAYVTRYNAWPYYFAKLLIPSVSGYHEKPEGYLYPRVTALYAHIIYAMTVYYKGHDGPKIDWTDALTHSWGRSNRENARDYQKQLNQAITSCCRKFCEISKNTID